MSEETVPRVLECPVGRAISVLQEKWMLHIVHALLDGPRGFNELGRAVGGCNPTTLVHRLARLEEVGLVVRSQEGEGRGRSAYRLTAAGEGLSDVIAAIRAWSLQHLHSAGPISNGALGAHEVEPDEDEPASTERAGTETTSASEAEPLAAS